MSGRTVAALAATVFGTAFLAAAFPNWLYLIVWVGGSLNGYVLTRWIEPK